MGFGDQFASHVTWAIRRTCWKSLPPLEIAEGRVSPAPARIEHSAPSANQDSEGIGSNLVPGPSYNSGDTYANAERLLH